MLKILVHTLLAGSALLPWNAPAIDRSSSSVLPASNAFTANYPEALLVKSLMDITQGKLQEAQDALDRVLQMAPNFKLAHLVKGDLLLARAQQLQSFGNADSGLGAISDLRAEARVRLEHYLKKNPSGIPEPIWQLDPTQKHAIAVDAEKSRLYLFQNVNGKPVYIADYYVTIGRNGSEKAVEGDKRTPIGVYIAGNKLEKRLPDLYGSAAYPLNYPNEWDRKQGKKGHGIWLHGTPSDTYSRPPRASDGCVVVANSDLQTLAPILQNGNTPFIIASNLTWLDNEQKPPQFAELSQALDSWRKDWQSQDTDRYLAHYSEKFFTKTADLATWARDKRKIQQQKAKVTVALSNISMFRYPNSQIPMAVVTFDQDYKSSTLDNRMRKRQYWIYENQSWKILYEGEA